MIQRLERKKALPWVFYSVSMLLENVKGLGQEKGRISIETHQIFFIHH